jgi:hypothetical protein
VASPLKLVTAKPPKTSYIRPFAKAGSLDSQNSKRLSQILMRLPATFVTP